MKSLKERNEPIPVTFKLPAFLRERAEETAKNQGMGLSRFIRESLHICSGFGPKVWAMIHELSDIHGITESMVINNILLKYMANSIAWDNVHPNDPLMAPEFMKSSKGPLEEDALLQFLIDDQENDLRYDIKMKDLLDKTNAILAEKG